MSSPDDGNRYTDENAKMYVPIVDRTKWPYIYCECGKLTDTVQKDSYVMFFTRTVCKECADKIEAASS